MTYLPDAVFQFPDAAIAFRSRYYHVDVGVSAGVAAQTGVDVNLVATAIVVEVVDKRQDAPLKVRSLTTVIVRGAREMCRNS